VASERFFRGETPREQRLLPAAPGQVLVWLWRTAAAPSAGRGTAPSSSGCPRSRRTGCPPAFGAGPDAPVTFQKGSRRQLAALNPSPGDYPRRLASSAEAPLHPQVTNRPHRAARCRCPGSGPASAPPTSPLPTDVASVPDRYGHGRAVWMEADPLCDSCGSCQAHASGTGTVPPANVLVTRCPALGRLRCGCIPPGHGPCHPGTAPGNTPGVLLQQQKFTPVFTVLNFHTGLDILNLWTLKSDHQGLISTQKQCMDTKI